jgi:glycosyltransferase involved in cell wall biosynthesis
MALSAVQRDDIVRLYGLPPEKVPVVGAGYNDAMFYCSDKPAPYPVQLVYAGKLARAKGVPWLLRALADVKSPDWHFHLVGSGSGEEKRECLALAQTLGERVTVHGAVNQARLAGIMRRAHIFVLPSFFEGLPLVLLEGLASGCRVIANDLPGVLAILGDVTAEFIRLVSTPRLHALDQPFEEDVNAFEGQWAEALRAQIAAARVLPVIDLAPMRDKLTSYSWKGIFKKIERIYADVLKSASLSRSTSL